MQDDAARPEAVTALLEVYHIAVLTSLTPALSAQRALVLRIRSVSCSHTLIFCFQALITLTSSTAGCCSELMGTALS